MFDSQVFDNDIGRCTIMYVVANIERRFLYTRCNAAQITPCLYNIKSKNQTIIYVGTLVFGILEKEN